MLGLGYRKGFRALRLLALVGAGEGATCAGALLTSAVLWTAGPSAVEASLIEAVDLPMLVAEAERVVLARVISAASKYDARGQIVTDVSMQVEETLKGDGAPGSAIVVRRLGGEVDGVGMRVSGEPTFEVGETVLLFARHGEDGWTLRPVGMSQGAVRVFEKEGGRWAHSHAAGLTALRRSDGGKLKGAPLAVQEPRKLDELLAEVRSLVAAEKKRQR